MLLYTRLVWIMMVLLVASTSLQRTLERRPTPFSKHKRRTSVVLDNNSPLQLRQCLSQMARFWAISICRRAVEPPSSTPCLVALLRLSERVAEVEVGMNHRQQNAARRQARLWGVGDGEQEIHARVSRAVNVATCRRRTRSLSLLCRCPKHRRPQGRWGGYPLTESNWRNHIHPSGLPLRWLRGRETAKVPERLGWREQVGWGVTRMLTRCTTIYGGRGGNTAAAAAAATLWLWLCAAVAAALLQVSIDHH